MVVNYIFYVCQLMEKMAKREMWSAFSDPGPFITKEKPGFKFKMPFQR